MGRDQDIDNRSTEDKSGMQMFGSDEEIGTQIPTQAQSVVEGSGSVMVSEFRPAADVDYLQVCYYSSNCLHFISYISLSISISVPFTFFYLFFYVSMGGQCGIHDSFPNLVEFY